MSKEVERINYEFKKRDLQEKYSYAISKLGTCAPENKDFWRQKLEEVNKAQSELKNPA